MKKLTKRILTVFMAVAMVMSSATVAFADTGLADGTYAYTVETGEKMFKVIDASVTVKDGQAEATLLLSGTSYYALVPGTIDEAKADYEAKDESGWYKAEGTKEYTSDGETKTGAYYTIPVESLDQPVSLVSVSKKYYDEGNVEKMFYQRTLTFTEKAEEPAPTPAVKDGTYNVNVETGNKMFKVVDATLTVKGGQMTALVTLSGTGYEYLYAGKVNAENTDALDTVAAEDRIAPCATVTGEDGGEQYQYEIPVSALDTALDFGAFSKNKQVWYARTLTFDSASLTAVTDGGQGTTTGGETADSDSLTAVTDGGQGTATGGETAPGTEGDADTEKAPKTGDESDIIVYALIALGVGGAAAAVYRKKNA